MGHLRAAMKDRYEERGVDRKVYTPENLETLELSFRHERVAKVRVFFHPFLLCLSHIRARLSVGLLPKHRGKVTSCLAWSLQRIAPIHSSMHETSMNLQDCPSLS